MHHFFFLDITYNDLMISVPYKNTFDVAEIEGKYIKKLLEYNALPYFNKATDTSLKLMQFSGKLETKLILYLIYAKDCLIMKLKRYMF